MLKKPECRISDLDEPEKRLMLAIIGDAVKTFDDGFFKKMGYEDSEETPVGLVDSGIVRVLYDRRREVLALDVYDFNKHCYVPAGGINA